MKLHWNCFVKPQLQSARPVHMISNCPILIKSGIDKCEAHFIVVKIFLPFYLFCFSAWPIAPLPCLSLFVFLSLCCSTLHDTFSVRTLWAGHLCCKINMITTFIFHLLITADYSTWHCLDFQSSDIELRGWLKSYKGVIL